MKNWFKIARNDAYDPYDLGYSSEERSSTNTDERAEGGKTMRPHFRAAAGLAAQNRMAWIMALITLLAFWRPIYTSAKDLVVGSYEVISGVATDTRDYGRNVRRTVGSGLAKMDDKSYQYSEQDRADYRSVPGPLYTYNDSKHRYLPVVDQQALQAQKETLVIAQELTPQSKGSSHPRRRQGKWAQPSVPAVERAPALGYIQADCVVGEQVQVLRNNKATLATCQAR